MLQRVESLIREKTLIEPAGEVTVLVSGGADSTCLWHVLGAHGYHVSAVHVNHKLRGAESEEDARFCADVLGAAKKWIARGDYTLTVVPTTGTPKDETVAGLPAAARPADIPGKPTAAFKTVASDVDRKAGVPSVDSPSVTSRQRKSGRSFSPRTTLVGQYATEWMSPSAACVAAAMCTSEAPGKRRWSVASQRDAYWRMRRSKWRRHGSTSERSSRW